MTCSTWRAAIFAALLFIPGQGMGQDVTLVSRDGTLEVSGELIAHDGEVYRLSSDYGVLTLDALSVICQGPGCPDLTTPKTVIRIAGLPEIGNRLLPDLVAAFAASRGWRLQSPLDPAGGQPALLGEGAGDAVLAEVHFAPAGSAQALITALEEGRIDLALTATGPKGQAVRLLGRDALVLIAAPDNPVRQITSADLVRILSGQVKNWRDIGGPDMPLVLYGLPADHPYSAVLAQRLGRDIAPDETRTSQEALAAAVARDPFGLAVLGQAGLPATAHRLTLADSCGFPLQASLLAVKAEDYPLTASVQFLLPRRRLPLVTREFLDFLALPAAQAAITATGLAGSSLTGEPLLGQGQRMINAINAAATAEDLTELQRLAGLLATHQRLSPTFRLEEGSNRLEPASQDQLADLASHIAAGTWPAGALRLVGFSDGTGGRAENLATAAERAKTVQAALKALLPDLPETALPGIDAFGEALPIACDKTAAGRRLNRRVELWLAP